MDTTIQLHQDFKEFLKLLEEFEVEYLLVGGYAVGYYGYPRPTGDLDIWIPQSHDNAKRLVAAINHFGFDSQEVTADLFATPKSVVRMGVPPFKLDIMNNIDGVSFESCVRNRNTVMIDGCKVSVISLNDLKLNKAASGRSKGLDDLEHL